LCGNGACEPTDGGPQECPGDCGPACGNCICEGSEDFLRCPIDCGYCGDGVCSMCGHLDEPLRCPEDCAAAQEICNGADDDGDGETDEGTCDDGDVCTRDLCEAESGRCTYPQADDGAPCDDDDACTEGDACEGGACAGTSKIDCDDGNDCTDDGCSPTAGCTHAPNDAQCNDDDRCTAGDACQAGICVGGPAFDCDDEDPCTDDACDPATGCTHSDPYPECAFPCKGGEPCELRNDLGVCAGVTECVGGEPVCNAREPSAETCNGRDDDCDAATDEDVPAEPCVVENQFGSCAGMTDCVLGGTVCPAPEPETEACDGRDNDCDGETDEGYLDTDRDGRADCADLDDDEDQVPDGGDNCPLEPNPGQEDFDDDDFGDVCDLDDDDDGSLDEEDCAPLDPGNAPGLIEVCDQRDNNCDGRADEGLCDDGNPCTDDGCDADGSCGYEFNTLPCEDGSLCTEDDRCENGRCQGGDDLDCDDGNPCTDDTCDPSSGCSHKHNTKSCDDGDPCTEPDACSGGECAGGPPKDCSDGDACNGLETCHPGTGGGCRPGTPPSCDAYPNSRCDTDLGCVCDPVDCAWLEVECGSAPDRCGALLECGDCPTEDLTCAAGRCLEVDGSPCESRAECASGLCVDGFCCATACTGRCRRCDIAGTFGQCDDTPAGIDPDDDCEGASVCDGARGCMCVPDCGSRECGDNGCGGSCGDCEETRICEDGTCRCRPKAQVLCDGDMLYWYDGCGGRGDKIADCPHGCDGSSCQGCPPACVGKECGPDGCGGTCGTCTKGVCLSQGVCGCRDGWECGPAEICHEAACGPAYGRAYRITIYEAEISDKKPGTDEDWDPFWDGYNPWGGLPDPKLRFKHGTFETTTSTASNTNRPRWNEHVDMLLEESDVLVFDVWDDDDVDEHIGGFSSTVRIRWLKNEAVELIPTDPDYGLQSLTLFFEAAPASCPSGNGKYCGESIGKTTGTLYNCSNGSWSVQQVCPGTCHVAAPGYADYCD